ncbi:hypothetical protein ACFQ80_20535 [Isoptericola sp. NPDC056578]|uniref:hypothetical protein n=1 Tax=Isoptericola sp. NPDC056578 TaxID=3345870 RepID=UPI0036AA4D59
MTRPADAVGRPDSDDEFFRSLLWECLPEVRREVVALERDERELASDLGITPQTCVSAYTLASVVLMNAVLEPALDAVVPDRDVVSRAALVIGRTLSSGSDYLADMISLRVTDNLLSSPRRWGRMREFAGPELLAEAEDRSQYFVTRHEPV